MTGVQNSENNEPPSRQSPPSSLSNLEDNKEDDLDGDRDYIQKIIRGRILYEDELHEMFLTTIKPLDGLANRWLSEEEEQELLTQEVLGNRNAPFEWTKYWDFSDFQVLTTI